MLGATRVLVAYDMFSGMLLNPTVRFVGRCEALAGLTSWFRCVCSSRPACCETCAYSHKSVGPATDLLSGWSGSSEEMLHNML